MLLAIDIGNTHTVIGVYAGDSLRAMWRIATNRKAAADELRIVFSTLFSLESLDLSQVRASAVASVVPQLTKAWMQAIKDAGYPSSLSNSAGTYICNHVMYGILYYIHKEFPDVRGGFIHVPYAASQAVNKPNTPSMAIADITAALEAAIEAAVRNTCDIRAVGGEIH